MARFTDTYIRDPVLAAVLSLLIFAVGLRCLMELPVRQYPKMENTVITINTSYPGASANLMEGFITSPLEKSVATAGGMDYLTSQSAKGSSTISAYIKLNYNPNDAFTNILSKVSEVEDNLPKESQKPIIHKSTGSTVSLMYMSFVDKNMNSRQLTDFITRVVQPKILTASGVSQAQILGGSDFAMRIWLDPIKMAAYDVSAESVTDALTLNNFQSAAGNTKGEYTAVSMDAKTNLQSEEGFKNLVIRHGKNGALVRLKDVANVELGADTYDQSVYLNGKKAVFIGVDATPNANPLTTITGVKNLLPEIEAGYPKGMKSKIVYDATKYIRASIHEVLRTIIEATVIVVLVIFLFLGSLRTVLIPVIAIPLSLIGVAIFMLALGYSYNLLTLLALVLAIGMVVDDAIVVVENVCRHIDEGLGGFDAAIRGAREIATPVISMTITLAAVYAPIGFMGGITGALFTEFAFTLASAVIVSGVIALTLSPMLCSRMLNQDYSKKRFVRFVDHMFERIKNRYGKMLHGALNHQGPTILLAFVVFVSCAFLYVNTQKELAPTEDQGALFVMGTAPQYANIDYVNKFSLEINKAYKSYHSLENFFVINNPTSLISAIILKPWDERKMSQDQVLQTLQPKLNNIAGLQLQAFPLPSLPVDSGGMPIQFEITSTMPFKVLYPLAEKLLVKARNSGLFMYVSTGLKYNKLIATYDINRNLAGQMGISMRGIASAMATALGGNYVNRFGMAGRSYKVIPQVMRKYRQNPEQLDNLYLKTGSNKMVPLSTIASLQYSIEPNSLFHFQQLNAITLQGSMVKGKSLDTGLVYLKDLANRMLPSGVGYDYGGQSRRYIEEGDVMLTTFFFSIIIIFLVLSAQFESFRDSLVILISVPMAVCGALIPLNAGLATINIYTQIGMLTLIGLISKNSILIVEFAKQLRKSKEMNRMDAVFESSTIRLRPILMTTVCLIFGVLPLLLASGAGAVSRFDIGLVLSSGMLIGTLFTLFVVPTMYTLKTSKLLLFIASVGVTVFVIYDIVYKIL